MKRVYIIADLYPPAFAPRVAYLTQYLERLGWFPIVFAEDVQSHQLFTDFDVPCPVYRIRPYRGYIRGGLLTAIEFLFEAKDRYMAGAIQGLVASESIPLPDALLCFSYRKFPLLATSILSEMWGVPWVADCRDIVEQYSRGDFLPRPLKLFGYRFRFVEDWLARLYIHQRNRAYRTASSVCTVSRWHRQTLSQTHHSVEVIYNGYDAALFKAELPQKTERFSIIFTGRLLSLEMRSPHLIFEALRSQELRNLAIDLIFYTDDYSAKLLGEFEDILGQVRIIIRPMVPSRSVPSVLASASLILLIGNEETVFGPRGMISTKLFEALAMQRPIVLLPDSTSETAELLKRSGLGLATNKEKELSRYILKLYNDWLQTGYTEVKSPNTDFIRGFTREHQAKQFASLLSKVVYSHATTQKEDV